MNNILNKIKTILYRRYGIDKLGYFIILLLILSSIARRLEHNIIVNIIYYLLFYIFIYRYLSTDYNKRRQENNIFLKSIEPISKRINMIIKNYRDTNYKYYTCNKCNQNFRVPKNKGKIVVTCPKCHKEYHKST